VTATEVSALLAFGAVAALLTVTPGLDTMVVLRSALLSGRRAGMLAGLGICLGVLLWGVASALGVSALLATSRVAFDVLRIAGGAYLVWIGARALWSARHEEAAFEVGTRKPRSAAAAFRIGLLTNLLNPKVGVFYVTLLPQFVPSGAPVLPLTLGMAAIHAFEGIVWFALIVLLLGRIRGWVLNPTVSRRLNQLSGVTFIGFGLRIAVEPL
jgi:RhtB (resistance to homoserine/threonine) family protein